MYTDPGSGLLLVQLLAAAALTMVYRFRNSLATLFRRKWKLDLPQSE